MICGPPAKVSHSLLRLLLRRFIWWRDVHAIIRLTASDRPESGRRECISNAGNDHLLHSCLDTGCKCLQALVVGMAVDGENMELRYILRRRLLTERLSHTHMQYKSSLTSDTLTTTTKSFPCHDRLSPAGHLPA
jgi:hypothetical protein